MTDIETRIRKILKSEGIKKDEIDNFIDDIDGFSDIELYDNMSDEEILMDYRDWSKY
jgi:hypothetical protein